MSYEKTVWETGDKVTAAKLNKLETAMEEVSSGGGSGGAAGLVVGISDPNDAAQPLNKTAGEIYGVHSSGGNVVLMFENDSGAVTVVPLVGSSTFEGQYMFIFMIYQGPGEIKYNMFMSSSADGYPTHYDDN